MKSFFLPVTLATLDLSRNFQVANSEHLPKGVCHVWSAHNQKTKIAIDAMIDKLKEGLTKLKDHGHVPAVETIFSTGVLATHHLRGSSEVTLSAGTSAERVSAERVTYDSYIIEVSGMTQILDDWLRTVNQATSVEASASTVAVAEGAVFNSYPRQCTAVAAITAVKYEPIPMDQLTIPVNLLISVASAATNVQELTESVKMLNDEGKKLQSLHETLNKHVMNLHALLSERANAVKQEEAVEGVSTDPRVTLVDQLIDVLAKCQREGEGKKETVPCDLAALKEALTKKDN